MTEWLIASWPLLLTVVLPFVVAFIARTDWSSGAKSWLATGLAALVGIGTVVTSGVAFTPENLAFIVAAVRGGVQVVYDLFCEVGITNEWLSKLLAYSSKA